MGTYTYTKAVNIAKLVTELKASSLASKYNNSKATKTKVTIYTTASLTPAEVLILDALIIAHIPSSLAENKVIRKKQVDQRTGELIDLGFTFDGNQFSSSANAQRNWMGIAQFQALLTFPKKITTLNDTEYLLAATEVIPFVGTALGTIAAHYESGLGFKVQIDNAITQTALDAITDNR